MRLTRVLILLLALSGPVSGQAPIIQEKPASPGESHVRVVFSASDAKGNPLRDLSKDRVFVYDNNQLLSTLDVQSASDLPLHLGFVLLASRKDFDQQQAAAIDLAQKVLRPGKDKAFAVTAGGERLLENTRLDWLAEAPALAEKVRQLDKNAGLPDAFHYELVTTSSGSSRISIQSYAHSGFSVFDVLWTMFKSDPGPARRAVVIFRKASAHSPGLGYRSVQEVDLNHSRIIATAQAMGVVFFTIGVEEPLPLVDKARTDIGTGYASTAPGEGIGSRNYDQSVARERDLLYSAGRHNVERIADETGGRSSWAAKKNYSDAVSRIANELAAQHIVIFSPAIVSAAEPARRFNVRVSGAKRVSAPSTYVVVQKRENE